MLIHFINKSTIVINKSWCCFS